MWAGGYEYGRPPDGGCIKQQSRFPVMRQLAEEKLKQGLKSLDQAEIATALTVYYGPFLGPWTRYDDPRVCKSTPSRCSIVPPQQSNSN